MSPHLAAAQGAMLSSRDQRPEENPGIKLRAACFKETNYPGSVVFSGAATMGNSLVVPQKLKYRMTVGPSASTSGYVPPVTESKVLTCSQGHHSQ